MAGYFEFKTAKDGQTYWNLKAGNHETILTSEMYTTRAAADNGMRSVNDNCNDEARYDRREQTNGKPYFVLKAGNGQVIGKSEAYESSASMENGIQSVMNNGTSTDIKDKTESAQAA
jgi:uncharacterized protein YegP (UPF0339 family)